MSFGLLCGCPRRDHEEPAYITEQRAKRGDPMGLAPGACRKYAADQDRGGPCSDCRITHGGKR